LSIQTPSPDDDNSIRIHDCLVGPNHPPFVIAELSANHGGSIERAIRIIDGAAKAGVQAVKFQAYTADSLTIDSEQDEFLLTGKSLWSGRRLYDLYTEAATPYDGSQPSSNIAGITASSLLPAHLTEPLLKCWKA
jgi:sialic acid synthase SpsE